MKNVSLRFLNALAKNTNLYQEASILFADGTKLDLPRSSFYISGNSYTDAAGSNSFPLGSAFGKSITISLVNDKEQFSDYDFLLAEITVYCCMDFEDGTTEKILFGTFTVTEPEAYGSIVEVTACDAMYRGDVEYTSNLSFPATARDVLQDSTSTCGVYLLTTTFANDDYIIQEKPEGVTHRDIWGACAMLAGGNARMDEYNRLCVVGYDFSVLDQNGADGGYFDDASPYASGDEVYGGIFDPWDEGDNVDGGTFEEMYGYHVLYKAKNLNVSTDDVVITGIKTAEDETEYMYGSDGYVISVENPLISGNSQDAVDRIGRLLVGVRFRPFEMDHIAYPIAEFGDVCYLMDRNRNLFQSVITDVNFAFYGYTTIKCSADDPIRNSSTYHSNTTQAVRAARKDTKKQISEYDKAVQMLTNLMSQSFGVFKSEEVLADGSVIYYMHNKPTLQESQTIWKMTADAFAVSTDGGRTWNAGMDSEGNAVVNVLSAIGINFEWAKGGTLTLGGSNNVNGVCRVLDASGNEVAKLDANGLNLLKGVIKLGSLFSVDNNGNVIANSLKSSNAQITGGTLSVGSLFSVDANGNVTANSLKSSNANITGGNIRIDGMAEGVYGLRFSSESGRYSEIGAGHAKCGDDESFVMITPQSISAGTDIYNPRASMFYTGALYSKGAYENIESVSPNVVIDAAGQFKRSSSSSKRYKTDITEHIPENLDPNHLYDIPVKVFKYKDGYLSKGDRKEGMYILGFVVEDFLGKYEDAIQYDTDGNPEMWNSQILIPAMLKLIQDQNQRIKDLEKHVKGV